LPTRAPVLDDHLPEHRLAVRVDLGVVGNELEPEAPPGSALLVGVVVSDEDEQQRVALVDLGRRIDKIVDHR
jgi:hypothetical protein